VKCALLIAAAKILAGCVTAHQARKQYDFGDFITPTTIERIVGATRRLRRNPTELGSDPGHLLPARLCLTGVLSNLAPRCGEGDQIVAQHVFRNELPAQTPDARGAALCLASAVNIESDELSNG
jgi:hypothetical protein